MEMRWRTKDRHKLTTYVRKFNASITQQSKRFPELADAGLLPEKLNIDALRESEMSRRDFNSLIRRIDRWFSPKSREIITRGGIKMTRWEYQNALNAAQRINYQKSVQRKRANRSGRQRQQVGEDKNVAQKLADLSSKIHVDEYSEFTPEDARAGWINFTKTLERQSKDEYFSQQNARYYYNYHEAIYENFDDSNARQLANFVEDFRLTGEELFELIGEYPHLDIDYMYGPEQEEEKMNVIMNSLPYAVSKVLGKERAQVAIDRFYFREGEEAKLLYRFNLYEL